jgi:hypothetical protein
VCAFYVARNPAFRRALAKPGIWPEGVLRQWVRKWGRFDDVQVWAVPRGDLAKPGAAPDWGGIQALCDV